MVYLSIIMVRNHSIFKKEYENCIVFFLGPPIVEKHVNVIYIKEFIDLASSEYISNIRIHDFDFKDINNKHQIEKFKERMKLFVNKKLKRT